VGACLQSVPTLGRQLRENRLGPGAYTEPEYPELEEEEEEPDIEVEYEPAIGSDVDVEHDYDQVRGPLLNTTFMETCANTALLFSPAWGGSNPQHVLSMQTDLRPLSARTRPPINMC